MRIEVYGEGGVLRFEHQPPFVGDVELRFRGRDGRINAIDLPEHVAGGGDSRVAALRQLAQLFTATIGGAQSPDLPTFRDGERIQRELAAVRCSAASRTFVTV